MDTIPLSSLFWAVVLRVGRLFRRIEQKCFKKMVGDWIMHGIDRFRRGAASRRNVQ